MILLHGGAEAGRFLLWGETPTAAAQPVRRKRRSSPSASAGAPPLPFGADGDSLVAAVAGVLPPGAIGFTQEHTIWLPTVGGQPVASSPLIAEPPTSQEATTLSGWRVVALPLTYGQAIDLLSACPGKDTLAPGVVVGKTLAYWAEALRLAGALVAREQFLPGVEQTDQEWRACWKPVLTGPDQRRLRPLAQAMPAACRAVNGQAAAPDRPAARA